MYNHPEIVVIDPGDLVKHTKYYFSWRTHGHVNVRSGEFVGYEMEGHKEGYKFKHVKIIPENRTTLVEFYADADADADGITFYRYKKDVDLDAFIDRVTKTAGIPAAGGGKKTKRRKSRHNRKTKRIRKSRHNRKTRYH